MASDSEKIQVEIESITKKLTANAQDLLDCSKGTISESELVALQEEQDALIATLVEQNKCLLQACQAEPTGARWKRIQKSLDLFQELNGKFMDNIGVRKGLIQFELKDVRKARQSLKEVRASYGKSDGQSSRAKVDTRS